LDFTTIANTEEHETAERSVQHSADGLCRIGSLTCRALELQVF
jgi:hypothetical protein